MFMLTVSVVFMALTAFILWVAQICFTWAYYTVVEWWNKKR